MPSDVVGTGGDGSGSVKCFDLRRFIVAGAGVPVAKHGNRALSSRSGAAMYCLRSGSESTSRPSMLAAASPRPEIGFMFAPSHHPAMKKVGPTRVELATRTIFQSAGPAVQSGRRQNGKWSAYFSRQWVQPLAQVLKNLGAESVLGGARLRRPR